MIDECRALLGHVLRAAGQSSRDLREAAAKGEPPEDLETLTRKIHRAPYKILDEDIDNLRSRYSEDALFEIIVAASVGAALERLEKGITAIEEAE